MLGKLINEDNLRYRLMKAEDKRQEEKLQDIAEIIAEVPMTIKNKKIII